MRPVTSRAGVTSKAGFGGRAALGRDAAPSRSRRRRSRPAMCVTSSAERSSIGISRTPSSSVQSMVEERQRRHRTARRCRAPRAPSGRCRSCCTTSPRRGGAVGADDARGRPGRAASGGRRHCRRSPCAARRAAPSSHAVRPRPGCAAASRRPRHGPGCRRRARRRSAPAPCPSRRSRASRRCSG